MFDALVQNLFEKTGSSSSLILMPAGVTGIEQAKTLMQVYFKTPAHPDGVFLEGPHKIDDIRNTRLFLQSKPLGEKKILWIAQADTMTPQAANALLKSLEEPTDRTHIILSASRIEKILPTIRSRCQTYSVKSDKTLMYQDLKAAGLSNDDMKTALDLSGGDVKSAILLAGVKDALKWGAHLRAWVTQTGLNHTKKPPLPPTGKNGLDARTCALVFQAAMAQSLRTRSNPAVEDAFETWLVQNTDIDRPGIDLKTRVLCWYALLEKDTK